MPGLVEQPERPVHGRRGGGVAELVGDEDPPVPVVVRVGLRVDLHEQRRRVDVAGLLTRRSSSRSVQSDGSESTISWKVSASGMIAARSAAWPTAATSDPDDPLAPARGLSLDGLLGLLEQLDGAEESAVARSALAAGVSRWWCSRSSSARSSAG